MQQQGFSPFLPHYEYIPDGEPHVFGNRLYLYGSHDRFGSGKFCLNDYVAYSAPLEDLTDWRFEGVIYKKEQDPQNPQGKISLYAPDVAQGLDGKYYLYYCLAEIRRVGVAVSDTPVGKFEFLGHVSYKEGIVLGERQGDNFPFDPSIFVDDGKIWLYVGNGPLKPHHDKKKEKACTVMELETDMLTIKQEPVSIIPTLHNVQGTGFEGHAFFEASSMRKFGDNYYLIYSSTQTHELCYAISKKPNADFQYGGVLISNGDIFPGEVDQVDFNMKPHPKIKNYIGNNHGSIVELNGKYYIFYHRHTNRAMYSRQACVAEIKMQADGSFEQALMTSSGLNGKPLKDKGRYEARIACQLYASKGALFSVHPFVQNKAHPYFTQTDCQYIANLKNGATVGFKSFLFETANAITITVRGKGRGEIIVKNEEKIISTISLQPSTHWECYKGVLETVRGEQNLYFSYNGKGAVDFLEFELS